jgi:hypothetical protein
VRGRCRSLLRNGIERDEAKLRVGVQRQEMITENDLVNKEHRPILNIFHTLGTLAVEI